MVMVTRAQHDVCGCLPPARGARGGREESMQVSFTPGHLMDGEMTVDTGAVPIPRPSASRFALRDRHGRRGFFPRCRLP